MSRVCKNILLWVVFKILAKLKVFISGVWEFCVQTCWSGYRMPYFFFVSKFFYFGTQYCFSCLGISCLLLFEWIWNALLFFWSEDFLFWGYRGFLPYANFITKNFITANFITAVFKTFHKFAIGTCHLCNESFYGPKAKRDLTSHVKKHTIKEKSKCLFLYIFIPFIRLSRVCNNILL